MGRTGNSFPGAGARGSRRSLKVGDGTPRWREPILRPAALRISSLEPGGADLVGCARCDREIRGRVDPSRTDMIPTTSKIHAFAASLLLTSLISSCQATGPDLPSGGLESLNVAKSAFFDSWTKNEGETWTPERLSRVLENSDAFLSFDGMSADKTVVRGYAQYAAIWGPGMAGFKTAHLVETENVHAWLSSEMCVTASIVRVQGEMLDGTKLDIPGHLTLAWNREGSSWRLVHEHMSLGVKQ